MFSDTRGVERGVATSKNVGVENDSHFRRANVIHRFVNGIELIAAAVFCLVSESIQSASQTFCAQTPVISRWRWMGMQRDDTDFLVVTQMAAE